MAQSPGIRPSIVPLRTVRLLAGLPDAALEDIAAQCAWRRFGKGQAVISREATDRDVYLIISGRLRFAAFSRNGKQVTYRDLTAGDSFGELSAIDGLRRSADVVALEDAMIASMPQGAFRKLVFAHPSVCDTVLRRLATYVRDLTNRVFEMSTLGVQNRVHAEIARLARDAGVKDNTARIEPSPKHVELATRICTAREEVTRELSAMTRRGLIRREGRVLIIPDVARLEQIVAEVRREA